MRLLERAAFRLGTSSVSDRKRSSRVVRLLTSSGVVPSTQKMVPAALGGNEDNRL